MTRQPTDGVDGRSISRRHNESGTGTIIKIHPGGHYVTRDPGDMIVTVLGSCVAACIRDPVALIGGMNHFMLPASDSGTWGTASASLRYGNFAMERLINDILGRGGHRSRLEIKIFGGARIAGDSSLIGPLNADFVEAYLRDERLPIAASHLRGDNARKIQYFPLTGRARMLELPRADATLVSTELGYGDSLLRRGTPAGSIELFE